jgi:hypothetical protein
MLRPSRAFIYTKSQDSLWSLNERQAEIFNYRSRSARKSISKDISFYILTLNKWVVKLFANLPGLQVSWSLSSPSALLGFHRGVDVFCLRHPSSIQCIDGKSAFLKRRVVCGFLAVFVSKEKRKKVIFVNNDPNNDLQSYLLD